MRTLGVWLMILWRGWEDAVLQQDRFIQTGWREFRFQTPLLGPSSCSDCGQHEETVSCRLFMILCNFLISDGASNTSYCWMHDAAQDAGIRKAREDCRVFLFLDDCSGSDEDPTWDVSVLCRHLHLDLSSVTYCNTVLNSTMAVLNRCRTWRHPTALLVFLTLSQES